MKSKVTVNYFYNLIYQILSIALPTLTVPYVSRVLGAATLGRYYYVSSVVTYFGIIAATGTVDFGQREIAKRQRDKIARSESFLEIFYFRLIFTVISLTGYIVFINLFAGHYYSLYFADIIMFFSWALDVSWYLQGVENFRATAIRNGAVKIICTILIFVFVRKPSDVLIYISIYAFANLIGNITMIPYLKEEIVFHSVTFKQIFRNFYGIMQLFFPVIAVQLYTSLNQTMLGIYSNSSQVGYYAQTLSVINLIITVITAYSAVLIPHIAYLHIRKKTNEVKEYSKLAIDYVHLSSIPMMIGFITLDYIFVPFFFGKKYISAIPIMSVLCLLFVILGLSRLLGSFLIAINKQHLYSISVASAAVTNLLLNYILLVNFHFGAIGVAWATVISEMVTTIIDVFCLKGLIDIKCYITSFSKYLVISLPILFIVRVALVAFTSKLIGMTLSIVVSVIYYMFILIITKDRTFSIFVKPIIDKLSKKS
ncbi:oligosaccharide flippase family protein [Limosilactobacillus pontis]|uniref:oligosaccharide flippase family protein n=1 Tax=Limosilactobacillus pontis TaxID=35787 RepID=UPI002F26BB93